MISYRHVDVLAFGKPKFAPKESVHRLNIFVYSAVKKSPMENMLMRFKQDMYCENLKSAVQQMLNELLPTENIYNVSSMFMYGSLALIL